MRRHSTSLYDDDADDTRRGSSYSYAPRPTHHRRRNPSVVKPRRTVESEPVVLLSSDVLGSLVDEQLRPASPVTAMGELIKEKKDPQEESRASDSSSRPRTSTSSTASMLPPTPQETARRDADEAAITRVFEHSIVLESLGVRPTQHTHRECQVCYEKMDVCDAETCSTCRTSFCANCMRWYMEYKILEGEVSEKKLVCPAPQCMRSLGEDYVQKFVTPRLYDKFLQYRENQRPGVRFCPRPGCCAKIEEKPHSKSRRVNCLSCHQESCMKCGDEFHVLPTCRRKERRYGKWRKRSNVRKCPSCKSDIEKQGGCAHMKCFQCDEEFCWSCLQPWDTHDETLCVPLTFLRSKDPKFGCCAPIRVVTKSVVIGAAAVVAVTGVGVAVVVVPPVLLYHWVRSSPRLHKREPLDSDAFIIE